MEKALELACENIAISQYNLCEDVCVPCNCDGRCRNYYRKDKYKADKYCIDKIKEYFIKQAKEE